VEVHDNVLEARFSPFASCDGLLDVANVEVTGPHAFLKTAGPHALP